MSVREAGASLPQGARFDHHAASYADEVNASIGFLGVKVDYFTRVKADYLVDLIEQRLGRADTARLLDVGCGVGNAHPLLQGRVGTLTGTDISAASVAQAAQGNPGATYVAYDGQTLPWADDCFDAAVTTCVMHHVPPPQWPAFTAELARVVRPGGLVAVFEHNPYNPLTRRAVSNCAFDDDAVLLTQRRTRELLRGAGLADVRSRSILSIPPFGKATRALDLALGRLSLGAQYFACGTVPR